MSACSAVPWPISPRIALLSDHRRTGSERRVALAARVSPRITPFRTYVFAKTRLRVRDHQNIKNSQAGGAAWEFLNVIAVAATNSLNRAPPLVRYTYLSQRRVSFQYLSPAQAITLAGSAKGGKRTLTGNLGHHFDTNNRRFDASVKAELPRCPYLPPSRQLSRRLPHRQRRHLFLLPLTRILARRTK